MSKKPDGYSSVIKPPLDNAVAAVNVSVALHPVFPATRSLGDITKDTPDTCPPIAPDATPTLARSADVETRMPVDDPAVGAPILKFVIVRLADEIVMRFEKESNDMLGFVTQRVHAMLKNAGERLDTATVSPLLTEVVRLIAKFEHETRYEPTESEDPVFVIIMELLVKLAVMAA